MNYSKEKKFYFNKIAKYEEKNNYKLILCN